MAGRLLAERVFENGARLAFGNNHMRVAEAEFAFRMAADVPPRPAVGPSIEKGGPAPRPALSSPNDVIRSAPVADFQQAAWRGGRYLGTRFRSVLARVLLYLAVVY